MTMEVLKNWRDEGGSDLKRAKAVIADKNNSLTEVSRITRIPIQTLRNYRHDISKLDRASWRRVNLLAQMYDIYEIQRGMTAQDVKNIQEDLHGMFDDLREMYSTAVGPYETPDEDEIVMRKMIDQMEQIITSDPNAVYKIFKATQE